MIKKTIKHHTSLMFLIISITTLMLTSCGDKTDPTITELNEFIAQQNVDKTNNNWKTSLKKPPEFKFSQDKKYSWHLETTEGKMVVEFLPNEAPMHVSSTA
ncbi:MAG: hypothetical protein JKX98_12825, partial [Alcanivoracaceae bacterium]|nr:hypothetical protein [Alcanivoracaceae bacterium]